MTDADKVKMLHEELKILDDEFCRFSDGDLNTPFTVVRAQIIATLEAWRALAATAQPEPEPVAVIKESLNAEPVDWWKDSISCLTKRRGVMDDLKPVAYLEVEPSAKGGTLREVLQWIIMYSTRWHFLCEKPEVTVNSLFPIYSEETIAILRAEIEAKQARIDSLISDSKISD